jgi:hypothetical protein
LRFILLERVFYNSPDPTLAPSYEERENIPSSKGESKVENSTRGGGWGRFSEPLKNVAADFSLREFGARNLIFFIQTQSQRRSQLHGLF